MSKTIASRKLAPRSSHIIPVRFHKPYRWIDAIVFGPSACSLQAIYVAGEGGFELLADAKSGFCLSTTASTEFAYTFVARHVLTLKFANDTDGEASTPQIAFPGCTDVEDVSADE